MSEDKNNPHDKLLVDQDDVKKSPSGDSSEDSSAPFDNPSAKAGSPRKPAVWGFFIIFLLVTASASAGGWLAFQYLSQQFDEMSRQQANALAGLSDHLQTLQTDNQSLFNQQKNLQRALTAAVVDTESQMLALAERLSESESTGTADWTLAEVEYLLSIANQRLLTSRDIKTAVQMMRAADKVLLELAYPELAVVRRQLAADISRLQLSGGTDVEGLYFELEAIAHQIGELEPFQPEMLDPLEYETVDNESLLKYLWNRILSILSRYVRIDTQSSEPQYLLTEEQQIARMLSVQLQIRQAQLAMLSGRQELFSGSLNASAEAIEGFYADNQAGLAIRQRLRQIANINLQYEILDIGDSIRALNEVVNQLSRVGLE